MDSNWLISMRDFNNNRIMINKSFTTALSLYICCLDEFNEYYGIFLNKELWEEFKKNGDLIFSKIEGN